MDPHLSMVMAQQRHAELLKAAESHRRAALAGRPTPLRRRVGHRIVALGARLARDPKPHFSTTAREEGR